MLVRDDAVDQRKQRVVATDAHVAPRIDGLPDLTHQDAARADALAAEHLHSAKLRVRATSVARRAAAFFMCHGALPRDLGDLHRSEGLAVTRLLARALALAELEDHELCAERLADDLALDGGACDLGLADLGLVAADHQHVVELDLVASRARKEIDADGITLGNPILLAAGADDCVGHWGPRNLAEGS